MESRLSKPFGLSCFFFLVLSFCGCNAHSTVPAIYMFGDSFADVGNNNHLKFSVLKANFPHNGVDYPGGKATGRFSNGKNFADFLAEKLGLPTSPPYLSISSSSDKTQAFLNGVSFASGGAGILDSTNKGQCLTLNNQIDYYATVYSTLVQQLGSAKVQDHLSKSIFAFIIGTNEISFYPYSSSNTPQQFADSLITTLRGQLQKIYNLGARKFAFIGTGQIGCYPAQRLQDSTRDCYAESNYLSLLYNKGAVSLLEEMKSELSGMSYSFFDTAVAGTQYIQNPAAYGFTEVKAACCGLGNLKAKIACLPISSLCSDRSNHLFWDFYHPTQTTADLLTTLAVDGSAPYVYPINVKQLSDL